MALTLNINGQNRVFDELASPASLLKVVEEMGLKADRIAVEHNGEIAPRVRWSDVPLSSGDRLEIVHFVGGGSTLDERGVRAGTKCCVGHACEHLVAVVVAHYT